MDNLFTFLQERLVRYKIPKEIIKVEKIPRNAMGKIVRSDLNKTVKQTIYRKKQ